jgi:hypothetical protein
MSTYNGAYSNRKYSSTNIIEEKMKEELQVLEGKFLDSYHYHGSRFEYTWELTLIDSEGKITIRKLDTWREYKSLSGETIMFNGDVFEVV